MSRTTNFDTEELAREIGPAPIFVNSDNRDRVQAWLLSQGLPSIWVNRLRDRGLRADIAGVLSPDHVRNPKSLRRASRNVPEIMTRQSPSL